MKVILAFDSFKGSLTAEQATNAVAMGIREIFPTAEIICLPMADGGEGTTEILVRYTRAKWSTCKVNDSLMRPIFVNYAIEENQRIALMVSKNKTLLPRPIYPLLLALSDFIPKSSSTR